MHLEVLKMKIGKGVKVAKSWVRKDVNFKDVNWIASWRWKIVDLLNLNDALEEVCWVKEKLKTHKVRKLERVKGIFELLKVRIWEMVWILRRVRKDVNLKDVNWIADVEKKK